MVKYEDLLEEGNQFLLDQIEMFTGIKAKCNPYEPQERKQRKLEVDFVKYLNEHIDWKVENLIGYTPIKL